MARRSGAGRLFRLTILLVAVIAAYFGAAGFVLDRAATRMLAGGGAPSPAADPSTRGDPGKALGLPFEEIAVTGPDGPLPAWYVAGPGRIGAILVHGAGGAREDGFNDLSLLAEAGLPALLISTRDDAGGVGGFGLTEWPDLEAAARMMATRGHDRLILIGDGTGAAIVGQFLKRSELRGHAVALAVDSPALDFPRVLTGLAMQMHLPFPVTVARMALAIRRQSGGPDLAQASVSDVMAAFAGPVFVAQGSADPMMPAAMAERLLAARIGVTVALKTGAGHLGSWAAGPEAYRRAFRAFLSAVPGRG